MLPVAFPLLTFLMLWGIFGKLHANWRSGFLAASALWASLLVAITELLSLFRALTFPFVLSAWVICCLAALAVWIKVVGDPRKLWKGVDLSGIPRPELALLLGGLFIILAVAVVAWIAPPNMYDAMTYHLPRVMHWIQDRSLDFYPTHILRQLYLNAGSEFVILHFQLLTGSDHLDNFVQWFSMLGSAIGVSLIARELGSGTRGQVLAAVASLTLPMGILQASSVQTDYVAAFWLVCFVFWMFAWRAEAHLGSAAAAGASLGLAVLAKSTAYIYAFPFLVWLVVLLLKRYRARALPLLAVAALAFISVNLGTYIRDQQLFGNPLGLTSDPVVRGTLTNTVFSVRVMASNAIRSTAVNLATPSRQVNSYIEQAVTSVHGLIGLPEYDVRTTWRGSEFQVPEIAFDEAYDGNLLHTLLVIPWFLLVVLRRDRRSLPLLYGLCLLLAFLLFSLALKWQPWITRLQLPLFVLAAALLGEAADNLRKAWISRAAGAFLLVAALPWVLLNHGRPLLGDQSILTTDRTMQYFGGNSEAARSYMGAVQQLASTDPQCRQIGLLTGGDDYEYPFWVLLQKEVGRDVRLQGVLVRNRSRTIGGLPDFVPCAILAIDREAEHSIQIDDTSYLSSWSLGRVSVWLQK